MRIRHPDGFIWGYNSITSLDGDHSDMLMDFGILKLNQGMVFTDDSRLEKVYLLPSGRVAVECAGQTYEVRRESFLDDAFWLIDVPEQKSIQITGLDGDAELAVVRTVNTTDFPVKVHDVSNSVIETRGQGTMNETGTRIVKTLLDHALAPESNIMLGEDVHYPGKWAGFPEFGTGKAANREHDHALALRHGLRGDQLAHRSGPVKVVIDIVRDDHQRNLAVRIKHRVGGERTGVEREAGIVDHLLDVVFGGRIEAAHLRRRRPAFPARLPGPPAL